MAGSFASILEVLSERLQDWPMNVLVDFATSIDRALAVLPVETNQTSPERARELATYEPRVVETVRRSLESYGAFRAWEPAAQHNLLMDILGGLSYVVPRAVQPVETNPADAHLLEAPPVNEARLEMLRELYEAVNGEPPVARADTPKFVWHELLDIVRAVFARKRAVPSYSQLEEALRAIVGSVDETWRVNELDEMGEYDDDASAAASDALVDARSTARALLAQIQEGKTP